MLPPVVLVEGIARFRENPIVSYLLEIAPTDLNEIGMRFHDNPAAYAELAALIGYSVSGWGDLSQSDEESVARADEEAEALSKETR